MGLVRAFRCYDAKKYTHTRTRYELDVCVGAIHKHFRGKREILGSVWVSYVSKL